MTSQPIFCAQGLVEAAGVNAGQPFLQFMAHFADLSGEHKSLQSLCPLQTYLGVTADRFCYLPSDAAERCKLSRWSCNAAVLDIWLPMAMGCATVIAPSEQMKDVEAVRNLISRHSVTCMTTVPSMFQVSAILTTTLHIVAIIG